MKFKHFSRYLSRLDETPSRNRMTEILAELLKKANPKEVDKICYLALGRLAPLYKSIEFNLAEKLMIRVLAQAYCRSEGEIGKKYKEIGDLGDTAAFFDTREAATKLSVVQVYDSLLEIAQVGGEGSVERKIKRMAELLDRLDSESVKYVVRIPLGRLRLGFSELTILDALSWMISGDKGERSKIEEAYEVQADIGLIARLIKEKGLRSLEKIDVSLGIPIKAALCQRLPTAEEIIKKMGQVAVEPKYDGSRLQIHFNRKKEFGKNEKMLIELNPPGFVAFFTRNLENVTPMFPDLTEAVFAEVKAEEAILDGEAVGFDPESGKLLPFQETIKRKRKYEVKKTAKEIPLRYYCFDLLYKDGKSLLFTPLSKRRLVLEKIIKPDSERIKLSPQIVTDDPNELRDYHHCQIEKGLEGAVIKKWEAVYDPGKRGFTWVKLKQEKGKKGGGLADTLDCLVMGYNQGKGKRTNFGIGAFLVGIRKNDKFLTISKIGTGLSDDQWREMHLRCEAVKTAEKPKEYQVPKELVPDVWCSPKIVVEIEADNVTLSPLHTAEYALRFPRLIRFRDFKAPQEVTGLAEVKKLYQMQ